ncbi:MAG: phosphate/phosphite/phosphonate ABC transporter substrate-binding protein [Deltaproteobacteria bacterium]|nr:phosphate/phosphite/phosphonate ABC transporter substrate-binding protein [Deltaproteobacteria bacterium]
MKHVLRLIFLGSIFLSLCIPAPSLAAPSQQKILIGIMPEMNVFRQKQRFKLLGEHLSKKSGVTVEFTILSRYGNIVERFTSEKMDGAFFGSFTGALAIQKLGVVPLARPVNLDGSSTYHGYLFTRKDSGIKSVGDMKNKKIAFVDKATTAGYIFPLYYLKENGVTDTSHFFRESFFAGSHDAAINAVLNKKADLGAAKHSIYDRERKRDPRVDRELTILAESPHVPSNGLCVRKDLPESIKSNLKTVLMNLHTDPEGKAVLQQFGALKFIETTANDYQSVFDLVKKSGIDITTYDYRNK